MLVLLTNASNGRLPDCFDAAGGVVDENSWWYRKVARVAYSTGTIGGEECDQLSVPRPDVRPAPSDPAFATYKPLWEGYTGALRQFDPAANILRCPASRDNHWDRFAPSGSPKINVNTVNPVHPPGEQRAKDRVFDDSYGYNNYGFEYTSGHGSVCSIYHTALSDRYIGQTSLYHGNGAAYAGAYTNDPAAQRSHIGAVSDMADRAQTLLIVDYIKADVAPTIDARTTGGELYDGYVARHGGKLNALFADGHTGGYRERMFKQSVAGGMFHWAAHRR